MLSYQYLYSVKVGTTRAHVMYIETLNKALIKCGTKCTWLSLTLRDSFAISTITMTRGMLKYDLFPSQCIVKDLMQT